MALYCTEHNCPWFDNLKKICTSPNDPCGGECDYDWASVCPKCKKLITVGNDDDGFCPYCGEELVVKEE